MSILINLGFPSIRYCSFPGFKTISFYTILDVKESLIDRIHLIPVSLLLYLLIILFLVFSAVKWLFYHIG